MEIFAKAMEYAKDASMVNGGYQMPMNFSGHINEAGERRLAFQAVKVLKMGISYAREQGLDEKDPRFQQAVISRIAELNERYGEGWDVADDGWCYKDFREDHELSNVLIFFSQLGVKWEQHGKQSIGTARHLRMSHEDFGIVATPSQFDGNKGRPVSAARQYG